MKQIAIDFTLAVLLTFPVYLALANNPVINDWFLYGRAWELFQPLFDIGHSVGIDRHAAIVIGTMFVVSFTLALMGTTASRSVVRHLLAKRRGRGCAHAARCNGQGVQS